MRGSLGTGSESSFVPNNQLQSHLQDGDVEVALTCGTIYRTDVRGNSGNALEFGIFSRVEGFQSERVPVYSDGEVVPQNTSEGRRKQDSTVFGPNFEMMRVRRGSRIEWRPW